jgi:hypothetical protein
MAYFIFTLNAEDLEGAIYKIAESQEDLNNLNITQSSYKIIEDSLNNFNLVKFGNKYIEKYNNNTITYRDINSRFEKKEDLQQYVDNFKTQIKQFLDNNTNHSFYNKWINYYNQLNDLDNITYPLNKSLEQYFNDLGQPSLHPLQLP